MKILYDGGFVLVGGGVLGFAETRRAVLGSHGCTKHGRWVFVPKLRRVRQVGGYHFNEWAGDDIELPPMKRRATVVRTDDGRELWRASA